MKKPKLIVSGSHTLDDLFRLSKFFMKYINRSFLSLFVFITVSAFVTPIFGQDQQSSQASQSASSNKQNEVIVHIRHDEAPTPVAPKSDSTTVQKANEWVEFGRNLGGAFDAGLTSLTDHAEKFSKTDAGHFTMAVIAWKVAGKDAVDLIHHFITSIFGITAAFVWLCIYIWFLRRFCRIYSVKAKASGPFWNRVTEYTIITPLDGEDRAMAVLLGTFTWFVGSAIIVGFLVT